jgi:hypothetical protein
MAVIRPFRALRAVPTRIDPAALAIVGDDLDALVAADPRSLARVLRPGAAGEDGAVSTMRARFLLGELLRAGLVARDATPALYVLRVFDGERARVGFFAAVGLGVPAGADATAGELAPAVQASAFDADVAGDAVIVGYTDKKGRVTRTLETETDRDPDIALRAHGRTWELWVVDEETAAARVTALVEQGGPRVLVGAGLLQTLTARRGTTGHRADGEDVARDFGLGFFVDDETAIEAVPAGLVLLPLSGAL